MQYLGGKSRIARHLAPLIVAAAEERRTYVEPFLGAGSVAALVAPHFDRAHLSDGSPDLMLLWQAMRDGWRPEGQISEERWRSLRDAEPSAERGLAGYGCSFGGKWFGGYARDPQGGRDYTAAAVRSITKKLPAIAHATLAIQRFEDVTLDDPADSVVYLDPPYAATSGYRRTGAFDSLALWARAETWVDDGAVVLVSEYAAPAGWRRVWSGTPQSSLRRDHGDSRAAEALWMLPVQADRVGLSTF